MGFPEDIKAAIAMLGGPESDPVVDFLVDPGAACRALDRVEEHGGIVIRMAPELGEAREGYGPAPVDPLWVRVMRGAREVGTASLRGGEGMVRRAARVELVDESEPCCDAPGCDRERTHATAWLVLEGTAKSASHERVLFAEQRVLEGEPGAVRASASRLAKALGVPIERGGEAIDLGDPDAPEPLGEAIDAVDLARFAIRGEGERVVLRNLASLGPKETARRTAWIGAALMAVAAVFWFQLWRGVGTDEGQGTLIGVGAIAGLFTLAGYAFLGVARFSARYGARSNPEVAVGRDKLIVAPWVSRGGAVDARPEGRLGAAIPLGEVRAGTPQKRGDGHAVELDTDHGKIDALVCGNEASAKLWAAVLGRAIDEVRHPRAGASARQRARKPKGQERPATA